MFETAELGSKVAKSEYKQRAPILRQELLDLQRELRESGQFPVIMVFAGVDGAGKTQTINLLNQWMDPRWLVTRAYDEPSEEERERPEYWRFWSDLPPKGRIGLFLSSWYSRPVLNRVYSQIDDAEFMKRLDRIVAFENALADDGALILKFWMHLSRDAQKRRLKLLEKDPLSSWRITESHWKHRGMYDQFVEAEERTIMRTSTGKATWHIVEGEDHNYRSLTVGAIIRDAIRKQLETFRLEQEVKARLQNSVAAAPAAVAAAPTSARAAAAQSKRLARAATVPTEAVTTSDPPDGAVRRAERKADRRRRTPRPTRRSNAAIGPRTSQTGSMVVTAAVRPTPDRSALAHVLALACAVDAHRRRGRSAGAAHADAALELHLAVLVVPAPIGAAEAGVAHAAAGERTRAGHGPALERHRPAGRVFRLDTQREILAAPTAEAARLLGRRRFACIGGWGRIGRRRCRARCEARASPWWWRASSPWDSWASRA